ncbi:MAG: ATP-binding protein [Acidimicrobiales bacterium]
MAEATVELEVPARAEFVGLVRLLVSTLAANRRVLADDRVDDLKLAVSEAATNAVEAYGTASSGQTVVIRWREEADRLAVSIIDRGGGFDPDRLPEHPPVTDAERLNFERGLGIPLIRALVDEAGFDSTGEGTTVSMVMFCGPREEPTQGVVDFSRN